MKKKIFVFVAVMMIMLTLVSCGKKYIVTFDTQGGSAIEEVEVKKGKKVSKPEDPVKEGYDFVEWQLNGAEYDFSTKVKSNLTLVAKWEIPAIEGKVKVIFDTQGGSKVESVIINKGSKVPEPEDPVKEGSVFAGWQVNGVDYNFDIKLTKNITLVAVWKTPLKTPTNVKYANNKVSWDKVEGATSYDVYVNGVKSAVNTNEYTIDLEKEKMFTFSVVAASNTGLSESSETAMYTLPYTTTQICAALDITENEANEYLEEFRIVLAAQDKFGITFKEFEEMSDPTELLAYIQNGRTSDLISFLGVINGIRLQTVEYEKPEMPAADLQPLFEDMKSKGAYSSNKTNYADDERFVELIVPAIGYGMYGCRYYDDVTIFVMLEQVIMSPSALYNVIRNNETYTFTKYDGKEFVLTAAEIESIINYYELINEKCSGQSWLLQEEYTDEIMMAQYMSQVYWYDMMVNSQKAAEEGIAKVIENYAKNKEALNATAIKLYDAYETAMTYETKLEELINKFEQIDSEIALTEFIEDARNFAIQVAELLEDNLPTEAEVELLVETLEGYGYMLNLNGEVDEIFKSLEGLLNTAISTVAATLSIIDEITVADIESLLNLMENPEDAAAIATVEKIIKLLETKLDNVDIINNVDLESILSILFVSNGGDLNQIKSLVSVLLDIQFTDEQVKELEDEVVALLEYINAYDSTKLEELLSGLYAGTADTKEVLDELFKLVDYVAEYFTSDKVVKYEKYIKSAILQSGAFDNEGALEFYAFVKNDFNFFVKYFAYNIKVSLIDEMFGSSSYDRLKELEYTIDLAKSEYTNEEYKAFMEFMAKGEQLVEGAEAPDESYKENLFYIDYQGSLAKLEKLIGKAYSELTPQDRQLINDADFIYWYYHDPVY